MVYMTIGVSNGIVISTNLFSTENKRVQHLHSHVASTVFTNKSKYVETIRFGCVQFVYMPIKSIF